MNRISLLLVVTVGVVSCTSALKPTNDEVKPGTFGYDRAFLDSNLSTMICLKGDDSLRQQLLVAPEYQGRVMTSTFNGDTGMSMGWINHPVIKEKVAQPHITAVGGEDRFWLGPEGGQFSIYFKNGAPFNFENWQVPAALDTEPFAIVQQNSKEVQLEKEIQLTNYSGTNLSVKVNRTVRVLSNEQIGFLIGVNSTSIQKIGFESENTITNIGEHDWTPGSGALSIWILGMMNATKQTEIIVPFRQGAIEGKEITTNYFGEIPKERINIDSTSIRLTADANYRAKIGISQAAARPVLGSYDAANKVLTLVLYNLPTDPKPYVNALWEIQKDPFTGDVVNAYNDGPVNGKQLGNFYELETSSPAAFLQPGQSLTHKHQTIHLSGPVEDLNAIALSLLGVSLNKVDKK